MSRVMAQGTFDLIHPGHLYYLQESSALGDELVVVISRDTRKETPPVMPEDDRRIVVGALEVVDEAVLGSEDSIFEGVRAVDPDIITLGYDQPYDPDELEDSLKEHGFPDIDVVRITEYTGSTVSSSELRERTRQR